MDNDLGNYFNSNSNQLITSNTIKQTVKNKGEVNGERYVEYQTTKLTRRKVRISESLVNFSKNIISFVFGFLFVLFFGFLPENLKEIANIFKKILLNFYDVHYFLLPYSRNMPSSWKFIYSLNAGMVMVSLSAIIFIIIILVEKSDGCKISFFKSLILLYVLFWGLSYINYYISFIFYKIDFIYKILVVILLLIVNCILSILYYGIFCCMVEDSKQINKLENI